MNPTKAEWEEHARACERIARDARERAAKEPEDGIDGAILMACARTMDDKAAEFWNEAAKAQ